MSKKCKLEHCGEQQFQDSDKCIFHCEKEEGVWYTVDGEGKKKWDDELVKEFWEEVRDKKMKNRYCDFSWFIFPEFENREYEKEKLSINSNFWKKGDGEYIDGNCFLKLNNDIKFRETIFLDYAVFSNICFEKKISFHEAVFYNNVFFDKSHFYNNCNLQEVTSLEEISFVDTIFFKEVDFSSSVFKKESLFLNTVFYEKVDFLGVKFSEEKQTLFDNTKFLANDKKSDKEKFEEPTVKFQNVIFPSPVVFRKCDLSYASFLDSRIENVYFDECDFLIEKSKKIKGFLDKILVFDKHYVLFDEKSSIKKVKSIETLYRRFKKNFDEKKDYHMADDFYGGEMEMKLKYLEKEYKEKKSVSKMASMKFLKAYKYLSDYNGNPVLPLFWMFLLILLTSSILLIYSGLPYLFPHSKFIILLFAIYISFFVIKILKNQKKYLNGDSKILSIISWGLLSVFLIVHPLIYISNFFKFKNKKIRYLGILFLIILLMGLLILNNSIFTSFQWAFTAAIPLPLIKFEGENLSRFQMLIIYIENIISVPLWALFILSLRRKFKR